MDKFKIVIGVIASWFVWLATKLGWLVGGFDSLISVFIILLAIDYIAGVIKAGYGAEVDSKIGSKGILRKFAKVILISLTFLIEFVFNINAPLREAMISFLIANECISIIENLAALDLPIARKLKPILKQVQDKTTKQLDKISNALAGIENNKDDKE